MRIEEYAFGRLVVDGVTYENDVIILPERVRDNWWREEGHELHRTDLDVALAAEPAALVIGTGASGRMAVPDALRRELETLEMELYVQPTAEAVKTFNRLADSRRTVAALHLTC
jgi:hypothetical protein